MEEWGERAIFYCGNILELIPEDLPGSNLQTAIRLSEQDQAAEISIPDEKKPIKMEEKPVRPAGTDLDPEEVKQVKQEDDREVEMMSVAQGEGTVKQEPREDVFEGIWEDEWEGE